MEFILDTVKCKTQLQVKNTFAHIRYNYNLDMVPKIGIQGTTVTTLLVHVGLSLLFSGDHYLKIWKKNFLQKQIQYILNPKAIKRY